MRSRTSVLGIEYVALYILFGLVLMFQYSFSFNEDETYLFIVLMATYIWIVGLLVYAKFRFDLQVFEPISIVSVIYICIFIVKPIVDLRGGEMYEHGIYVLNGGVKATVLFVLGYTVLYFSYYLNHKRLVFNLNAAGNKKKLPDPEISNNLSVLYIVWAIVFVLCIIGLLSQGLSLRYIFSFGAGGERVVDDGNTALLFLSNFGVTLVALWLMIIDMSKNMAVKITTTALCIIYILMRNARWLMLVFIVAPIALYFLKRHRQPRLLWIVLIGFAGLLVFAWMQANRYNLATGGAMRYWSFKDITLSTLLAPLESDFSTYRTFYSMVQRFPSQYSYMMGTTFLYTFIIFVPRIIWPGKPDNPIRDMIEHSLNQYARKSGTSVANIGEFYANFGVIGIVLFMYLLGWILAAIKKRVFSNSKPISNDGLIFYAIIYPLLFQWIARGNFSGNFYLTLFAVLPYLFRRTLHQ
jgi:oligosaccharide repeat unit polymerase